MEDIKEGSAYKITKLMNALEESPDKETSKNIWDNFFKDFLTYLDENGVRQIDESVELPDNPYGNPKCDMWAGIYKHCRTDLLEDANFKPVKRLI